MITLAFESSAITASVAICHNETVLGEYTLSNRNTHSVTLLPMAEELLRALDMSIDDVDLFAVAAGPGSFTGVRIGAATVKGLAFGKGKPCIGVSTLEALAARLPFPNCLICPAMNARRKQVYTALFRAKDGKLERLMPDSALAITALDELLTAYDEPVMLCGDGYDVTISLLTHPVRPTPERLRAQSAYSVAQIARMAYDGGLCTTDTEMVATYLRLSQAERERLERESKHIENSPKGILI